MCLNSKGNGIYRDACCIPSLPPTPFRIFGTSRILDANFLHLWNCLYKFLSHPQFRHYDVGILLTLFVETDICLILEDWQKVLFEVVMTIRLLAKFVPFEVMSGTLSAGCC